MNIVGVAVKNLIDTACDYQWPDGIDTAAGERDGFVVVICRGAAADQLSGIMDSLVFGGAIPQRIPHGDLSWEADARSPSLPSVGGLPISDPRVDVLRDEGAV